MASKLDLSNSGGASRIWADYAVYSDVMYTYFWLVSRTVLGHLLLTSFGIRETGVDAIAIGRVRVAAANGAELLAEAAEIDVGPRPQPLEALCYNGLLRA